MTAPTWWPVTVIWPDDRIVDAVHATTREEAEEAAADNWPGAATTITTGCWALVDAYGALAIWNNDRHMPTQSEAENYRIRLGLSVNQYPVYQLTRPCHVVRCDVCGLPADPEGDDEPVHYSSVDAGVRVALDIGWARTGRGLVCGNCH